MPASSPQLEGVPSAAAEATVPPSGGPSGGTEGSDLARLLAYREVLAAVVRRDLLVRYKQSFMGLGWALFVPLTSMLVFTVVFTRVVPVETEVPYPVFAYAGLLAWSWLAAAIQFGTVSLTGNMSLVTRVYFPRVVFPLSAVLVGWVDFMVGAGLLAVLMVAFGVPLRPTVVLLPVLMLVQAALALAIALFVAVGNAFFRDVRYVVTVTLPLWMFATPVVYPLDAADPGLQRVLRLNPATPLIEGYRSLLFEGSLPPLGPLALTAAGSFLALAAGWKFFHAVEHRLAELI